MKFLLSVSCNVPDFSGASIGVIELSKETAQSLLDAHREVRAFVDSKATDHGLSKWLNPSFGWVGVGPSFLASDGPGVDEMVEMLGGKDFLTIENGRTFAAESADEADFRTECNRVEFAEESIRFTAMAKHGNEEYSTGSIPLFAIKLAAA